jgi:molybdopterin molybdotransferase
VGEAGAGHGWAGTVLPGQALRIFTGAPVPAGATRVILQEDVTREGDGICVNAVSANTNIRPLGSDFRMGDRVTPRRLGPNDIALLAAMNLPSLPVRRRPVVALIATGDELVMPGQTPGPDQIIASNSFALAAMVEAAGGVARMLPIARDTVSDLEAVLTMALDADLVVTIGGASVGDHDLVGRVAESMGLERAFYKIAMRPGKPLMAGRLRDVPMLGLPGNPVSAIVCGHLFLLPLLRAMQGDPAPAPKTARARLR